MNRTLALSARKFIPLCLVGTLFLSACGAGENPAVEEDGGAGQTDPAASKKEVEDTVKEATEAESNKDVDKFLEHWTDAGLKSYTVGSREDLKAGKSEDFGRAKIEIVKFSSTKVTGKKAETTVDAQVGEAKFAHTLDRVKLALINKDDKWLIDGFEYLGGPPAAAGTPSVAVEGREYAFALDKTEISGVFAMVFKNSGKEPHEITMFKAPADVSLAAAKTALEKVDGQELKNVPGGYEGKHISFAEPGKTANVTFSQAPPAGTYILACYIPEGGFNENGPVNPDGKLHIELGMISMLKVK